MISIRIDADIDATAAIAAVAAATTLDALRDALMAASDDENDRIDWCELPTFGGDEPADTVGVWSWDATRLLVGRCRDELTIIARD